MVVVMGPLILVLILVLLHGMVLDLLIHVIENELFILMLEGVILITLEHIHVIILYATVLVIL